MTGEVMLLGSGCSFTPMWTIKGGVKALSLYSSSSITVSIILLLLLPGFLASIFNDVICSRNDRLGQTTLLMG